MKNKPILIVAGEPYGIFFGNFFQIIKKKYKSPIVLICCKKNLESQIKKIILIKKLE